MRHPVTKQQPRVGIKYCGGCNPSYDRVAIVDLLIRQFEGKIIWCSYLESDLDLILVVSGCQTNCVDIKNRDGTPMMFLTSITSRQLVVDRLNHLIRTKSS